MAVLSKWAILDSEINDGPKGISRKVFDPHIGQLEIMEHAARMKAITAGRRFGKSQVGGNELIPEAMLTKDLASTFKSNGQRREFWIVGPEYSDSEKEFRVFYNQCKRLELPFDKPGTYYSVEAKSMTVSLWDGAFILHAKSSKYPETLVGEALSGVIMAEAAKQKEKIWINYIRPTLSDFKGWALFSTTPEGKNWYYDLTKNFDADPDGWIYRGPAWRNNHVYKSPTLDEHVRILMHILAENPSLSAHTVAKELKLIIDSEVLSMANMMTVAAFQQEIGAEFTDFVGKVFKFFDAESHVRPLQFNPGWETIAAIDYGYTNPNVWLLIQIGPWGEINVLDEFYMPDLTPEEFAYEVLRRGLVPDSCYEFFPDPASPGSTKTIEKIFARAGKKARGKRGTGGELNERLNLIRMALKVKIGDTEYNRATWTDPNKTTDRMRPKIMFDPKCVNTIREFEEYRYPDKKDESSTRSQELPMKKDDHTPEALGRFFAGRFHSVQKQYGGGGARVTQANFIRDLRGHTGVPSGDGHPMPYGPEDWKQTRRGTWVPPTHTR